MYVNYHGGGWVAGGLLTDQRFCSRVVNEVGCVVVDVDYRLAPEFPWPAQLQDSWAALLWVCTLSIRTLQKIYIQCDVSSVGNGSV